MGLTDIAAARTGRIASLAWDGTALTVIDQRRIPDALEHRVLRTVDDVIDAIATLAVRGANVIGTAGAFGFAIGVRAGLDPERTAERLIAARPTAVNLQVAVHLAQDAWRRGEDPTDTAIALLAADRDACRRIGEVGRDELAGAHRILTHCNTGVLSTTGWGTALGVIYAKAEAGHPVRVFATETRPLRQGARLTAWELDQAGIDVTLIADSAAAALLAAGGVDAVIVGADRIAANGDTGNKVGTLALALAARHAGVPFYVAATLNAVDVATPSGGAIEIEERDGAELRGSGTGAVPARIPVWNPAFDVTPAALITAFFTEAGVQHPPFAS